MPTAALLRPSAPAMTPPSDDLHLSLSLFQRRVADLFLSLSPSSDSDLLSAAWLLRLLDTFLVVHCELHSLLPSAAPSAALGRVVADHSDRSLKTLDVLNALRDALDNARRSASLAAAAAPSLPPSAAALRRARRALAALFDSDPPNSSNPHRNRSIPARSPARPATSLRSLTWTTSRPSSPARLLGAIAAGLSAPRSIDGVAAAVYTMDCVSLFVMWALVAAIPGCGDREAHVQFGAITRGFEWAGPMTALWDRIEGRRRERKRGSGGLLRELKGVERCVRELAEAIDGDRREEVEGKAREMVAASEELRSGLEMLERQVREVFRRIVKSRVERLDDSD